MHSSNDSETQTHTWAELTVVSDIMGQKLFLIQNDSLTFGPLTALNTAYLPKFPPTFSDFVQTVGQRSVFRSSPVRGVRSGESSSLCSAQGSDTCDGSFDV